MDDSILKNKGIEPIEHKTEIKDTMIENDVGEKTELNHEPDSILDIEINTVKNSKIKLCIDANKSKENNQKRKKNIQNKNRKCNKEKIENKFQCKKCEKIFIRKEFLHRHELSFHENKKSFVCTFGNCKVLSTLSIIYISNPNNGVQK